MRNKKEKRGGSRFRLDSARLVSLAALELGTELDRGDN